MNNMNVRVNVEYLAEQSDPGVNIYSFTCNVTMHNMSQYRAKVLSRYWIITDANGEVREIQGQGVAGKNPTLKPGEVFEYSTSMVINTPVGSVQGLYHMITDQGVQFYVTIAPFSLAKPHFLH